MTAICYVFQVSTRHTGSEIVRIDLLRSLGRIVFETPIPLCIRTVFLTQ